MKRLTSVISLILVLLILASCGYATVSRPEQNIEQNVLDAYTKVTRYSLEPVTAAHGEDYVIEWEDAGMEAHIRFLLDKPEGDILHSDVWDVQLLCFNYNNRIPADLMIIDLPEGYDRIEWEYATYEDRGKSHNDRAFPDIVSLRDLRHFDSLQVFDASLASTGAGFLHGKFQINDLSGLDSCKNLVVLSLIGIQPESLEPLVGLPRLEIVLMTLVDPVSLEPLTELPALELLNLNVLNGYPTLEPLTRTTVKYLDLSESYFARTSPEQINYEYLAQIPGLVYLDVRNLPGFDQDACQAVLEGCENLRHLNISYTDAANAIGWGRWDPDLSSLISFEGNPK